MTAATPSAATQTATMLPPPIASGAGASKDSGPNPIVVNGRSYTATVGSSISGVPAFDADVMEANGWTRFGRASGTTAQRPVAPYVARGSTYYDTTVGHIIVFDGVTWRDHDGSAA